MLQRKSGTEMTGKPNPKAVRCAIYTRVSTDSGLDQDFSSLDAQREACAAYITSQKHEGRRAMPDKFNDGGFSGGSLERPALQELLHRIRARALDVIVVYKVDRLTRSLSDFAQLVDLFDKHNVSFVSVTQAFNTTTSMGRLTLNVLLSFAQFEREVTAERIRDKIAASKKKGLWMGGVVPLGYRVEARQLHIVSSEANTVCLIFERYRDLKSLPALQRDLRDRGVVTRVRHLSSGRCIGGVPLTNGPLLKILRNRMYIGEICHRGASYPGAHQAIVDAHLFDQVQELLEANRRGRRDHRQASDALLIGKIFDDRGNRMTPSYALKKGVRYRYYVSSVLAQGRKDEAGSVARVSAKILEDHAADALANRFGAEHATRDLMQAHVYRVVLSSDNITIDLDATDNNEQMADTITVPWSPPCLTRHRATITAEHQSVRKPRKMKAETRVRIIIAIAKARLWVTQLMRNEINSIAELAKHEGCSDRTIRMRLTLAPLAPDIVKAAIDGSLPSGINLSDLMDLPPAWQEQRLKLGVSFPAK